MPEQEILLKLRQSFIDRLLSKVTRQGKLGRFPRRSMSFEQYGGDSMIYREPDVFKVYNSNLIAGSNLVYTPPLGKRIVVLRVLSLQKPGTSGRIWVLYKAFQPVTSLAEAMANGVGFMGATMGSADIREPMHGYFGKRGVQFKPNENMYIWSTANTAECFLNYQMQLPDWDR